jgi:Tfp pilus assembly protein PilN
MIKINLRPGAKRQAASGTTFASMRERFKGMSTGSSRDPWQMLAIATWGVVIIGLGFLLVTSSAKVRTLTPQLEEANTEFSRYQTFTRQKRQAERARDSILGQIGTIAAVDRDRYVWPHILDEVGGLVPEFTWLTSVTTVASAAPTDTLGLTPPVVFRIVGRTGDLAHFTTYMRRLEASPWLVNVIPAEAKTIIVANRPLTEFSIQATFSQADSSHVRSVPILESVVED